MQLMRHLRSRAAAFAHDVLMIPVAWLGAYWLRFNLETIPPDFLSTALRFLPLLVLLQAAVFSVFGLYRGVWRFASIPDLLRIAKAVAVGTASIAVAAFLISRMQFVPRSVVPLYAILLFCLLGGNRFIYRWLKDSQLGYYNGTRVLIAGCGEAGEQLVRDLLRQRPRQFQPVAFADDNPAKIGREIHGIRVAGRLDEIPQLVRRHNIELILIAIPSLRSADMRRLVGYCEMAGVAFRTLPRLGDLVSGQVTTHALREVSVEDLLGREPVELGWDRMRERIHDRTVLVTGGGGSIGSELCRQLAALAPRRLVVVDNTEYNLYAITGELAQRAPGLAVAGCLVDVCEQEALQRVFARERPEVVFHAAAYKHVPLLEQQVAAAVRNNVFGTLHAAQAALAGGCGVFVLISTDKAVNPANVMGATKRVAELVCRSMNDTGGEGGTAFITVRFGNVLNSAGSVVPLFRRQIAAGGPVTVTHPEVTRYFMTIAEATQLIIEAAAIGRGGETYVLEMGEPVRIHYLAEQMIRLAGLRPDEDIRIVHTGLRPGEKLYEELFYADEVPAATDNAKILLSRGPAVDRVQLGRALGELRAALQRGDEADLVARLSALVPGLQRGPARRTAQVVALDEARR